MWNVFILSMLWCNIRFFSANVIRKPWLLKHKFSLENSPKCPYPTIPTFKALSAISTKWDKGFIRWTMKSFFLFVGLLKYFRRACYYSHLLNNNCNTVNSRTSNQHALDLLLYPPPHMLWIQSLAPPLFHFLESPPLCQCPTIYSP